MPQFGIHLSDLDVQLDGVKAEKPKADNGRQKQEDQEHCHKAPFTEGIIRVAVRAVLFRTLHKADHNTSVLPTQAKGKGLGNS